MARPPGPQVTSSACVRRDLEGPCPGEWLSAVVAGLAVCVCLCVRVFLGGMAAGRPWGADSASCLPSASFYVPWAECDNPTFILGHPCHSRCG